VAISSITSVLCVNENSAAYHATTITSNVKAVFSAEAIAENAAAARRRRDGNAGGGSRGETKSCGVRKAARLAAKKRGGGLRRNLVKSSEGTLLRRLAAIAEMLAEMPKPVINSVKRPVVRSMKETLTGCQSC